MQFVNSSIKKLVKNLTDGDIEYLTEEIGSESLELLKQKGVYLYDYMDSFGRFDEQNLPDKICFYSSIKECENNW